MVPGQRVFRVADVFFVGLEIGKITQFSCDFYGGLFDGFC